MNRPSAKEWRVHCGGLFVCCYYGGPSPNAAAVSAFLHGANAYMSVNACVSVACKAAAQGGRGKSARQLFFSFSQCFVFGRVLLCAYSTCSFPLYFVLVRGSIRRFLFVPCISLVFFLLVYRLA